MVRRYETEYIEKDARDVKRHLVDLGVVEFCGKREISQISSLPRNDGQHTFNISQHSHVLRRDKVYRDALPSESAAAADAMDVVLPVRGQIVIDDERHLLYVDSAREQVRRDEHAGRAGAELLH